MNQLLSAISEYIFYGTKSKERFKVSRNGIRFNSSSENNVNFNKWMVISKPGMGGSKILSDNNEWHSTLYESSPHFKDKFYFDSAEDAISALNSIENNEITPYPQTTLLATMLENECFPDNLNEIIQKDTSFCVWNESDYSDLELEISVTEIEEGINDVSTSMNLHIVFYWEESRLSLDLGTNMGDGFNEGIKIELDINQSFSEQFLSILEADYHEEFYRYVNNLRHDANEATIRCTISDMMPELSKLESILKGVL